MKWSRASKVWSFGAAGANRGELARSYPDKERQIAPLAAKGALFLAAKSAAREYGQRAQGRDLSRRDADAARKVEPVIRGFSDVYHYFGPFGSAARSS
jgi:hypothetical protein